jgi:uncharacterized protein YcgL (UPF0745 family)
MACMVTSQEKKIITKDVMQSTDKKEANIYLENREDFTFVAKYCKVLFFVFESSS